MKIWREISHNLPKGCCLAMGNFDGVHLGHRALIKRVVEEASSLGKEDMVVTFDPHPSQVVSPCPEKLLTPPRRKEKLMASLGIHHFCYLPFDENIASLSPEDFVHEILWKFFRPHSLSMGFNFTFGRGGQGDCQLLQELGKRLGFKVNVLPPVTVDGVVVSSSAIRKALDEGDILQARRLLGYWPVIEGRVVEGEGRGRDLGFPTANIEIPACQKLPRRGVYAAWARLRDRSYPAAVNIGICPTFSAGVCPKVEAHLLNFTGESIYGETVELELRAFLRPERRFPDPTALAHQIAEDCLRVKELLSA